MPRMLTVATVPDLLRAFLLPHARYFRARGWEVDAAASGVSRDAECLRSYNRLWDIPWSRRPLDHRNLLEAPGAVRRVVAEGSYDLVHVHTPIASLVTRYVLRRRPAGLPKVIYTAHGFHFYPGGPVLRNQVFRLLEKRAGRWTDYLVVINRDDQKAALDASIVPSQRLRFMPGIGLDTSFYSPDAVTPEQVAVLRAELDLRERDRAFLMIAEFTPGKRHCDALGALARLSRNDVVLLLAGSGRLMPEVRRQAEDLGVAGQVRFLGYRHDIPVLVRAAVATVLPSEREGLPRSVMESLSLAVPAIGSRIRGIGDLITPETGFLVNVGDVAGLADAMDRVLCDPELARKMGEQGRRRMEVHDLRAILAMHEELYAEALAEKSPYATAPAA